MPKVEFLFDFGSPNAYLSHLVIPDIEKRQGVRFDVRADPAGRRLQADQQPLAGRDQRRHQEQAGVPEARDRALHQAARHHALPAQPVLPGQHADDHARRRRGAEARRLRALRRRGVPAHVGRAQEDGRPRRAARGAGRVGAAGRSAVRARADQEVKDELLAETQRAVERGTFGSPTFFVDDEIYFGKDRCATSRRRSRRRNRLLPAYRAQSPSTQGRAKSEFDLPSPSAREIYFR